MGHVRDDTPRTMQRERRLLTLTFLESLGTIFVERGVFFFAHVHLHFSEAANLWLSLSFGVAYVLGALASHVISRRLGEKLTLMASIVALLVTHIALMAFAMHTPLLFVLNACVGVFHGVKWPVIESYVSAGQDAGSNARSIGHFNLAWSIPVPLALALTGPLNISWPMGLFAVPAAINVAAMWLCLGLPLRPAHLPGEHPTRPSPDMLARMRKLLSSSRWLLMVSYACLWIISALVPFVLSRLMINDALAPALAALIDVFRVAAFFGYRFYRGWIGCPYFLALQCVALPIGFFMTLLGPNLLIVIVGELIFGCAIGGVYYAAIYYALVVKNASVDAGGAHEALIGSGFTLGPAVGLFALWMTPHVGSRVLGTLLGVGPLVVIGIVGALVPLRHLVRSRTGECGSGK